MKKFLTLILIVFILCGCSTNQDKEDSTIVDDVQEEVNVPESSNASIVCPAGAPSLAFYNEIDNTNFNTGDAASILPELKGSGKSDVVVIDTVNGIKALNVGGNYYLAATITFGNFYIGSTGNDDNGVMDDGDYIVVFSQGATPDLIFHYLYGETLDSNLHYVQAVSDASACLIKGINISDDARSIDEDPYVDYVMIAEPALSAALSQNDGASVYANVQDLYSEKSGGLGMIQASVFVRKDFEEASAYLSNLESNINLLINNPELFANAIENAGLGDSEVKDLFGLPNSKIATKVLTSNSIGLGYKSAIDNKQAIDSFIKLFGMEKTSEEIYFK